VAGLAHKRDMSFVNRIVISYCLDIDATSGTGGSECISNQKRSMLDDNSEDTNGKE